jgi:hypothetical protein
MKQQTAVEWLINEIKAARRLCDDLNMEMDIFHTLDVLIKISEQAKEMEKQSLEKFYKFGLNDGYNDSFEQHYKETFKNQ